MFQNNGFSPWPGSAMTSQKLGGLCAHCELYHDYYSAGEHHIPCLPPMLYKPSKLRCADYLLTAESKKARLRGDTGLLFQRPFSTSQHFEIARLRHHFLWAKAASYETRITKIVCGLVRARPGSWSVPRELTYILHCCGCSKSGALSLKSAARLSIGSRVWNTQYTEALQAQVIIEVCLAALGDREAWRSPLKCQVTMWPSSLRYFCVVKYFF